MQRPTRNLNAEAVDEYVAEQLSVGRWSPATCDVRHRQITGFIQDFVHEEIASVAVAAWITGSGLSASYRRTRWFAVNGFLVWAGVDLGLTPPPLPTNTPRPLPDLDVAKLLGVCDLRDEVIVSLGICEGLRRGEMAVLEMSDLDFDGEVLFVHGKGGKQRWVPLTKATRVRIERYLDGERGYASGPLLVSRRNGASLEPATVTRIVSRALKRAGINRPGANLHSLRHTAATRLWMETSDLFMTQQLLGHSSIRTTAMYVKARPTAAMKDAMDRCST